MIRLPRKLLCMDWDKRALRVLVARVGGGMMVLEDAHSHCVPPIVDVDEPRSMGDFISQTLRRHHWHHKRVIVDVPRDRTVINRLTLAPTPADELAAAVRFQAMRELPFPLDEAVIDFVTIRRDETGKVTEVLLAAVRNDTLERLRETCRAAGLTPARIGLRPYANRVSVTRLPGLAQRCVLFVDVGPTATEIDIVREGLLAFSRAANVNVPTRGEESDYGEEAGFSAPAEQAAVETTDEATAPAVAELVLEIVRTLQAFRATEPNAEVNQVIIAGGTGVESELIAAMEPRLGLKATLFDPTDAVGASRADAVKLRSFSALLGLAWGLSTEGQLEIDFLNPKRPVVRGEALRRRLRIGGIAAASLLVVATAIGATYYRGEKQKIATLRGEVSELTEKLVQVRTMGNRVDEVANEWAVEAVWLDHLLGLTQAMTEPGQYEPGKEIVARQISLDTAHAVISMQLYCRDSKVATDFVKKLNELEIDGKSAYQARQGTWREVDTGDERFKGTVDVRVDLLDLRDHHEGAKDRERKRKERLKPQRF